MWWRWDAEGRLILIVMSCCGSARCSGYGWSANDRTRTRKVEVGVVVRRELSTRDDPASTAILDDPNGR